MCGALCQQKSPARACLDRVRDRDRDSLFFTARVYDLAARACGDLAARAPGNEQVRKEQATRAAELLDRLDLLIRQLTDVPPLVRANRARCAAGQRAEHVTRLVECRVDGHPGLLRLGGIGVDRAEHLPVGQDAGPGDDSPDRPAEAGGQPEPHSVARGFPEILAAAAQCGLATAQAIGAALLLPASLSIVLAAFPIEKRAVVVSLWGAVGALAAALGPSAGSFLIEHWGWQWAFFINLPLGAISLFRGARGFTESRNVENGAPLDWIGVTLLVSGVGAVAVLAARRRRWADSDAAVLGLDDDVDAFGHVVGDQGRQADPQVDDLAVLELAARAPGYGLFG